LLLVAIACISTDNSPNNPAAEAALHVWWKQLTTTAEPTKAGTVIPGHTFTYKGRTRSTPRHVQTKADEAEETADAQWAQRQRAVVQGFSVKGKTVTVLTSLTRPSVPNGQAEELCHELGGFVLAGSSRRFGVEIVELGGSAGL
jgi:hypothetical protein